MSSFPSPTLYHRWLGWHAPALRRAVIVVSIGVAVAVLLLGFVPWELAAILGWDAAAIAFLATVWPIIARATGSHTEQLATKQDETRGSAALLLTAASVTSLLGAGFALDLAGRESGIERTIHIAVAVLTVVLSWVVVNTVYTERYTHVYYQATAGSIAFGGVVVEQPSYRDFAYVAFTIGMTYQVSDTDVRDPRVRRTVLAHALLAYLFGVVIVAGAINLIAGLIR